MIVFKLGWLPYILILTGIVLAADGQPAALILTVAGSVWLYFDYKNKQSAPSADAPSDPTAPSSPASTVSTPYSPVAAPTVEPPVVKPVDPANEIKFCGHCGAKTIPGSVFCSACGEKLR